MFLACIALVVCISVVESEKIECTILEGYNMTVFDKFMQKRKIEEGNFKKITEPENAVEMEVYSPKHRTINVEMIKYDLSYKQNEEHFEWTRKLFFRIRKNKIEDYKFRCFANNSKAYVFISNKKLLTTGIAILRETEVAHVYSYLVNVVKLFKKYDDIETVFTDLKFNTLSVEKSRNQLPIVSRFENVIERGKTCYIPHHNPKTIKELSAEVTKIKFPKANKFLYQTTATRKWHIHSLFTEILGNSYEYINLQTHPENKDDILPFKEFVNEVEKYQANVISSKFETFSWHEFENLIRSFLKKSYKKQKIN